MVQTENIESKFLDSEVYSVMYEATETKFPDYVLSKNVFTFDFCGSTCNE